MRFSNLHAAINILKPDSISELFKILECYRIQENNNSIDFDYSIKPVHYYGALQGLRIKIKSQGETSFLPSKTEVYSIFK